MCNVILFCIIYTADEDYIPIDIEVIFERDETYKLVSIPLTEDDLFPENNKTFEVYLAGSPGVFISPIGHAFITILNDDAPLEGWCYFIT